MDEYRALSSDRTGSLGSSNDGGIYSSISSISSISSSGIADGDSRSARSWCTKELYSVSSKVCNVVDASSIGLCGLSRLEEGDVVDAATASQSRRISLETMDEDRLGIGLRQDRSVNRRCYRQDDIQGICATSDDTFSAVESTVGTGRGSASDITPNLPLATFETRLSRSLPRNRLLGEADRLLSIIHPGKAEQKRRQSKERW